MQLLYAVVEQLQRPVVAEQAQLQAWLQVAPQQLHAACFSLLATSVPLRWLKVQHHLATPLILQESRKQPAAVTAG